MESWPWNLDIGHRFKGSRVAQPGRPAGLGCHVLGDGPGCSHAYLGIFYSQVRVRNQRGLCPGGTQFHTGLKKSSKTFVNPRKGKLTTGNALDCLFPLGGRNPLLGHNQVGQWGAVERENRIWPCHQVHRAAQGLPLGLQLGSGPPILCPTTTEVKGGFSERLKEPVMEPKGGKHRWALT